MTQSPKVAWSPGPPHPSTFWILSEGWRDSAVIPATQDCPEVELQGTGRLLDSVGNVDIHMNTCAHAVLVSIFCQPNSHLGRGTVN